MLGANKTDKPSGSATQATTKTETEANTTKGSLIQECPDQWIDNRMPSSKEDSSLPSEYFIFDGQRKEPKDYDVKWIKANCSVEIKLAY